MPFDETPEITYHSIDDVLAALKAGRMAIVVDPRDRENEGDFICPAETITPDQIDFMLREGRGDLCVPMSQEYANRLQLISAVAGGRNTSPFQTPFLMRVDHRNAGTGVSNTNRARTIRALADPNSQADDFVHPGHVSPLRAKDGGVLRRAGHTEAAVDLMRLAGLHPVGVLIEILSPNSNGMATRAELHEISARFGIPIISIAELIQHRRLREELVHRQVDVTIPTECYGDVRLIAYSVDHDNQEPLAMVWGDLRKAKTPLVRVHSSCFTGDVLGSLKCDCSDQLQMAMAMIHSEGAGAIVYLPQEGRGIGLVAKLKAYDLQNKGLDTVEANHSLGFKSDYRDYMIGLQILHDLGIREVRLLTNNPKKTQAFECWSDLKVVEQVPIVAPPVEYRARYLATKRDKMGHLLPSDS